VNDLLPRQSGVAWIENLTPSFFSQFFSMPNGNPPPVLISDLVALPFKWGSALRGKKFFHPVGVVAQGSLKRIAPACQGLPLPSGSVTVRISKATGTPGALPDLIGLAIRVPPQHSDPEPWDVLLASAGSGAVTRALALRPVTSWTGRNLTTLMPLDYHGKKWWLRARIESEIDGTGLSLNDVRDRIDQGGVQVAIEQACGGSAFEALARLTLTSVVELQPGEGISFDPVLNTAPGVRLYPAWLADLRASAYARSRDGRDAAQSDAAAPGVAF
jgi:hypothetical protein